MTVEKRGELAHTLVVHVSHSHFLCKRGLYCTSMATFVTVPTRTLGLESGKHTGSGATQSYTRHLSPSLSSKISFSYLPNEKMKPSLHHENQRCHVCKKLFPAYIQHMTVTILLKLNQGFYCLAHSHMPQRKSTRAKSVTKFLPWFQE